jgi:hypothetical protein
MADRYQKELCTAYIMRCCFDVPAPLAQFSNILELCGLDKLDEAYACLFTDMIQASWVIHSFVQGTP